MTPEDAMMIFKRLGVSVQYLSRSEFDAAYQQLARRYHPDKNRHGHEVMAHLNAARTTIIKARLFERRARD